MQFRDPFFFHIYTHRPLFSHVLSQRKNQSGLAKKVSFLRDINKNICVTVPWGCTGTLDGLAIYPTLTICYWRVVIHASLDTRFKGMQVVTYPATVK